jgi:hypothetical protein
MKGFKYCKDYNDYLCFAKSFCGDKKPFNLSNWNDFFGAYIPTDIDNGEFLITIDEYNQQLEKSPDIYSDFPVIVYYYFDNRTYRSGELSIEYWDWESLKSINNNRKEV